jgi:hypothetical protein
MKTASRSTDPPGAERILSPPLSTRYIPLMGDVTSNLTRRTTRPAHLDGVRPRLAAAVGQQNRCWSATRVRLNFPAGSEEVMIATTGSSCDSSHWGELDVKVEVSR